MKRKIVLIIGYNGKNYHGSQHNQELPTIELEIINCLLKINAIKEINSKYPQKLGLQRGSRTDKGVHAAMAAITIKIEKDIHTNDFNFLQKILKEKNIHLYKIVRVSRSFSPKNACNSRIYEYLVPTFILTQNMDDRHYRIPEKDVDYLNELFKKYIGTHNFEYFTLKRNDKGTKRYIKDIKALEKIYNNDIEYLKVSIQGNSFMLHQVRKMIGFVVSIFKFARERSEYLFSLVFSPKEEVPINIPKAPSEFLFLDKPVFEYFNERTEYEKIDVEEFDRDSVKNELIYPEILRDENLDIFVSWFSIFEKHDYTFKYLTENKIVEK